MISFSILPSYVLFKVKFCVIISVKAQQHFTSSNCMFLGKKTLLKIWLNPGLNLTIFRGTEPREFPKTLKKKLNSMRVFIGQAALTFCSPSLSYSRGVGGGEDSWEFLVEVCRPVLQILTLFQTKNVIFHTGFQTWPLKSIPILRPAFKKLCHHY